MRATLSDLADCPLDQLVSEATKRLRVATLDELAAFLIPRCGNMSAAARLLQVERKVRRAKRAEKGRPAVPSIAVAAGRADVLSNSATSVEATAKAWHSRHGLTASEADVLMMAARGVERARIAKIRRVSPMTVKTQIRALLKKVKAPSLQAAVERLLRETMGAEPKGRR